MKDKNYFDNQMNMELLSAIHIIGITLSPSRSMKIPNGLLLESSSIVFEINSKSTFYCKFLKTFKLYLKSTTLVNRFFKVVRRFAGRKTTSTFGLPDVYHFFSFKWEKSDTCRILYIYSAENSLT